MIRQRISLRRPLAAYIVRGLTVLLGLALIWYGLMTVLLAVKTSPHTVNSMSGYRSIYNALARLTHHDFTAVVALIAGFIGLIVFLAFLFLMFQQLPRPYLMRSEVTIDEGERGRTILQPRAIERVAEAAAHSAPYVAGATGRLGDGTLTVDIAVRRAASAVDSLRRVQGRVREELERHELPNVPVNVTLTGLDRKTRRELS